MCQVRSIRAEPRDIKAFRQTFATALVEGGEADTQVARLRVTPSRPSPSASTHNAFERPEGSQVAADFADAVFNPNEASSV